MYIVRKNFKKTSNKGSKKTSNKGSRKISKKSSRKISKKSSRKISNKVLRKNSKKSSRKISNKVLRKTSKKGFKKTSKKSSRKTSKKGSKKTSNKGSKKTSNKVLRKNSKKSSRKNSNKGSRKNSKIPDNIIDKALYKKIKDNVKKNVNIWPSAYASGLLVKEYKKAGGRYSNKLDNKSSNKALTRWFDEEWIDICTNPPRKCGGQKGSRIGKNKPYCRPKYRINKKTPMTVNEIKKKYGKEKIKEMCKKKKSGKRAKL